MSERVTITVPRHRPPAYDDAPLLVSEPDAEREIGIDCKGNVIYVPVADVDALIRALRYVAAGTLGRAIMDAEEREATHAADPR